MLCFVVVMQSFIMNSHEVFVHIHKGCFAGTGAIVRLPQCQWSKPGGYGKISQCITTTKHSKAKTVSIFLEIYCINHTASHANRQTQKDAMNVLIFYWIHPSRSTQHKYLKCWVHWETFSNCFDSVKNLQAIYSNAPGEIFVVLIGLNPIYIEPIWK